MTVGIREDLNEILATLEKEQIPHMLVGGLALEALGIVRFTRDIDIQVSIPALPATMPTSFLGCLVDEVALDPVFRQETLVLHIATSGIPIELFRATHWFTVQALARRTMQKSAVLGRSVPIPTPEDFILLKLAYSASPERGDRKSVQDAIDIESVVEAHRGRLDLDYLRENAKKLGVGREIESFVLSP